MAYKRNPVRCERICALSRYVIALRENGAYTAATQWLERTLDDSANRRIVLPDAFLATDALLILLHNVTEGLELRTATTRRNVECVMPFMSTERWLMLGVKAGGEGGTTPAPAVVINAIVNALADYGVRDITMPATPERVWRAMQSAK